MRYLINYRCVTQHSQQDSSVLLADPLVPTPTWQHTTLTRGNIHPPGEIRYRNLYISPKHWSIFIKMHKITILVEAISFCPLPKCVEFLSLTKQNFISNNYLHMCTTCIGPCSGQYQVYQYKYTVRSLLIVKDVLFYKCCHSQ